MEFKHRQVNVGEVDLHVVEVGEGKPVLFCHGFPDLWIGWRRQMQAVAAEGYRAIALDMRGYGRSTGVNDPQGYSAFQTVGDLIVLLEELTIEKVTIVGHDFGAAAAWFAAMMRPDIFTAVYCLSVPYLPPSDTNFVAEARKSGKHFYMIDQMKPDAPQHWANAKVTVPSFMYWSSGAPPIDEQWDPLAGIENMVRPSPVPIPPWADREDMQYVEKEFDRTGLANPLHYYTSIESFYELARPFRGAKINQPAYFLYGEMDGVAKLRKPDEKAMRVIVPGLKGFKALQNVGHWPQQEAADEVNRTLLTFLQSWS